MKQNSDTLFSGIPFITSTLLRTCVLPSANGSQKFGVETHPISCLIFRGEGTVLTKKLLLALSALSLAGLGVQAQTLTNLTHPAPDGAALEMQLTDGTVLVQGYQGQDWYKLTPDNTGSYVNGTWTQVASLESGYDPDAMAEAVLADGRVLIEGGEYNFGNFSFTNWAGL